jgi:hypothetical protein
MDARLEQIFREETRRALGGERMTAERLMQAIIDFPATAPPEELAIFAQGIQALAVGMAAVQPATLPEAPETLFSPLNSPATLFVPRAEREARDTPVSPPTDALRPVPAPFRVSYPAPAPRPRAVPPEPAEAPEPDPPADDIEDFTDSATGS